jgi:hypothetical protein
MLATATPGRIEKFNSQLQAVYQETGVDAEQMEPVFDACELNKQSP